MWEEFCSWLGFTEGVLSLALKCCRRARRSPSLPSSSVFSPLLSHVMSWQAFIITSQHSNEANEWPLKARWIVRATAYYDVPCYYQKKKIKGLHFLITKSTTGYIKTSKQQFPSTSKLLNAIKIEKVIPECPVRDNCCHFVCSVYRTKVAATRTFLFQ